MTYVIKHDFESHSTPYYVNLFDSNEFHEIYNPSFATQFDTVKDAKEWINTFSPVSEYSKIVKFSDAISDFEDWAKTGMIRRTLKVINISKSRPYNGESLNDVIDWWIYARQSEGQIKYEHYKTWPKLYEMSKHLWNVSCYWNSNYNKKFLTFEIYTKKDGVFEDFEQDINRVIDFVTYKDDEGYLIFPIFDHFLSEHGNSVSLLIHPETKNIKMDGRYYGNDNKFPSLEKFFEYMKQDRYYE